MKMQIKKTFIEFVDEEELCHEEKRHSAPACFAGTEPSVSLKLQTREDRSETNQSATSTPSAWSDCCEESEDDESRTTQMTTVIIRNIPPSYTRSMLLNLLDQEGFAGQYDFVYLPIKIKWNQAFGYAFVNFVNESVGESFLEHFANFSDWGVPHKKCAEVDWTKDNQGLEAQVQRYRDSPMMQVNSPDEMKPIILKAGTRVAFPEPTKVLAESKPNSEDTREQRCQTWGHSADGTGEGAFVQESSHFSIRRSAFHSEDQMSLCAQKKAERSVKRIQSKLVKLGHK